MSEVVNLEELCTGIIDCPHSTPKWQDKGIPVIRNYNLKDGKIDCTNLSFVSEEDYKERVKRAIPEESDIIISREAPMGVVGIVPKEFQCCLGQRLVLLKIDKSKCIPKYLLYTLMSEYVQVQIRRINQTGSIVSNLNISSLKKLKIPLHNFEEQRKIANILSAIDDKIQINNQINQELEAMAKTLYDYWFVQFDFPDQNGKPYKSSGGKLVYNQDLKREIPEGWGVEKLGDIANITMGQSPKGTSYNEVGEGMLFFQGSTDFGWRFPVVRQYTTEPSRIAEEDDILLSVRAPVGTLNIADTRCCIGRGLAAINSKVGVNSYIFNVMQDFKKLFDMRNSVGTTFGSITKDDLYSLQLVYPPNELLMKFDQSVKSFDREIKNRSRQNQGLTQLRDWILPMLMNGQVKVE
ncbi:restriction endonuclease subunit S [Streptococcus parasanguinis]|uniref:restriction endonuclease subunit S n=1 Tax=Streptococcus parasanguinis TaxID=1318 RepID=UPI002000643E|nr:restriction endonuclease subunit S [Streptococcus parasanguinis]